MSRPPGHVIVPASGSTSTRAKYAASRSGSKTPCHLRPAKSTSPMVPSSKVSRNRWSPITSTAVMSTSCSTARMLGQRIDGLEGLLAPGPLPVRKQLLAMDGRPFGNERECTSRQRAGDHLAREIDRRGLAGVARVEVRTGVDTFVPVNPDRDPVEEADPGTFGRYVCERALRVSIA